MTPVDISERPATPGEVGPSPVADDARVSTQPAASQPKKPKKPTSGRRARSPRRARTDRITTAWLVAALAVMAVGLSTKNVLPQPLWTMIHVVTLGVLSNAIMQWTWFFTRALLHLPPHDKRAGRDATARTIAFNLVLIGLVAAMWTANVWGTVAGATGIGAIVAWHGMALLLASRTKLGNRFAVILRYYVASAAFLVLGCILAGFLTVAMFDANAPEWLLEAREGITVAHALVNVCGWVGLTITGTLVTLWPTILRTKMDPAAPTRAVAALPWMASSILVAATCAIIEWMPGVGIGLLGLAVSLIFGIGAPMIASARAKVLSNYATWTMAAAFLWIAVGLGAVAFHAFTSPSASTLRTANLPWLAIIGAGGLGQILMAALAYLMPVVIGGGPAVMRQGMAILEFAAPTRVMLRNAALALLTASAVSGASSLTIWWVIVLACFIADVAAFAFSGIRQVRARRVANGAATARSHVPDEGVTPLPSQGATPTSGSAAAPAEETMRATAQSPEAPHERSGE